VPTPGGRVIIFDPAMGLIGRFVLGCFHHEPLGLDQSITWEAPKGSSSKDFRYYAAQGSSSLVFTKPEFKTRLADWRIAELTYFSVGRTWFPAWLWNGWRRSIPFFPNSPGSRRACWWSLSPFHKFANETEEPLPMVTARNRRFLFTATYRAVTKGSG
jgi:hypothetical protein